VQGLPKDFLETYTTRINSVEPEQIQAAARKYLATGDDALVVVGDAEKLKGTLEKLGKFEVVKPQ
jgi:predicted Zn-dependent peptidase